jgi:hypothetical protein
MCQEARTLCTLPTTSAVTSSMSAAIRESSAGCPLWFAEIAG